ncbi:hypothetical protein Tco_0276856 [Tanacetum coccineum]
MYYKKNLDFVALIWEDLAYQIDNIDSKKQDKMFYPRFIKIIIHHFLTKDKSISWRNKMFMQTTRDDSLLGTMRFVSRHANTQVYGAILPKAMTNQALLDSVSYKTYHAIASGAEPPMPRKGQKKPTKAKKDAATKPKPSKKKAPVKADSCKGLTVLSEAQLKEATKRSKKEFYASHASSSGVPDVPIYKSKSEQESWGDSEEHDDDENDSDDKGDDNDGDDNDDDDDKNDDGDDKTDNNDGDDNDDDDDKNDDGDDKTDNMIMMTMMTRMMMADVVDNDGDDILPQLLGELYRNCWANYTSRLGRIIPQQLGELYQYTKRFIPPCRDE